MNKNSSILKNFSYTLSSNLISIVISALAVFIVPKMVGIEAYGYWQLFLFYSSYVGFLHFGWADGIYLLLGGKEYDSLDKKKLNSQFVLFFVSQVSLSFVISIIAASQLQDLDRQFVLFMTAAFMIIVNTRQMLQFILQATNRLYENALILIIDRSVYIVLVVGSLLLGNKDYQLLIILDLIGRFVSLVYTLYCTRDIITAGFADLGESLKGIVEYIRVGSKLMFSTISGMLTVGIVRLSIEKTWNVETFGKVSLALSISNLLMIFINAMGIILFPILRRADRSILPKLYEAMRNILLALMFGYLLLYWPLRFVFLKWLPQYSESILYVAMLFPMCIYESETAMLNATYLKTLRKETALLTINVISLFVSIVIALITTLVLKNLTLAVGLITFVSFFRGIISEIYVTRFLGLKVNWIILFETVLSIAFIVLALNLGSGLAIVIYLGLYLTYLLLNNQKIKESLQLMKILVKNQNEKSKY